MNEWFHYLRVDPLPALMQAHNPAIRAWAQHDLLGDVSQEVRDLWDLPAPRRLIRAQQPDGRWQYPGKRARQGGTDYDQLETYRNLGILVEQYGFDCRHDAIRSAAEYLLGHQTADGDIRGIYGTQYTPNYTAAITELLVKAGYGSDPRIGHIYDWLIGIRQYDGGWAIPLRTRSRKLDALITGESAIEPDPDKPAAHLVTGIVLRAFAAHPRYRFSDEAHQAACLLMSRFFKPDAYPDRKAASYWTAFSFPFWQNDLISALDSLYWLGCTAPHPPIDQALHWLSAQQTDDGSWQLKLLRGADKELPLWLSLAICRIFKRYYP